MTRPSSPRRTVATAGLVLALALGAAACSSKGDSDGASSTTAAVTSTSASSGGSTTTSDGSSTTSTTTGSTTSTTAAGASTTSTTSVGTSPGGTTTAGLGSLPEGTHYGYFTGVTDGQVEGQQVQIVSFDKVDFLTGDAAIEAAIAHGDAPAGATSIDDDYYIVNDNKLIRLLPVIPEGVVSVLRDGSTEPVPGSIDEAVSTPGLYKIEVVVVRGVSLITGVEGVYLP